MQFEGGYKYPSGIIAIVLSIISVIISIIVWFKSCDSMGKVLSLFLNLEGTVLLASALTPVGLTPPPKGIIEKLKWFFKQGFKGVSLRYNQIMFYGGLFCLFVSHIISS